MQSLINHRSSPTGSTGSRHRGALVLMPSSNYNSHLMRHGPSRGPRMIYRAKITSNSGASTSELAVQQPPVAETRDPALPPMYPRWVENLLIIAAYNFPLGLVFFCASCNKGRLFQGRHFEAGADHHGHDRLRMYDYESSLCVNKADIESLGVDTAQIQEITWSVREGADSTLFIFLHGTAGYADSTNSTEPWKNCARATCRTRLHHVREWINCPIRFCSLDCKLHFFKDLEVVRRNNQPYSLERISSVNRPPLPPLSPLPRYESHLSDCTFAQITRGSSSKSAHTSDDANALKTATNNDIAVDLDAALHALSFWHLDESDPPSVQLESPNARAEDQIDLPEVLYKDHLDVLLFPSEDAILSSMQICSTPPVSPRTSLEGGPLSEHLDSCANSNPVESPDPLGLGSECALSNLNASLSTASRLIRSAPQLKERRTGSLGALGLTRKSLEDNISLRELKRLLSFTLSAAFSKSLPTVDQG